MPDINIPDVPKPILRKLNAEAKKRNVGVSTIVTEAIAAAFPYVLDEPPPITRYGGGVTSPDNRLVVDVPESARKRLRKEGPGTGSTIRAEVINALADRYDLPRVPNSRQPRAAA